MNLLGSSLSLISLKNKSNKAIVSFSKIVEELRIVNERSISKQNKLKEEQALIEKELVELENMNTSNLKIINNIEKILS